MFIVMAVSGLSLIVMTGCSTTSSVTTFEQIPVADVVSVQSEVNHANNYMYQEKEEKEGKEEKI
ncbi:hypothetical protein, partial [Cysteiniphilum litorale]|uniref:hypothetical protein n=1 Tax=Cysteiniphilum litorale TaxID=2056700 RepID=UPI003F88589D